MQSQLEFDVSILPEQAKIELMDYYEFLVQKYASHIKNDKKNIAHKKADSSYLLRGSLKAYRDPQKIETETELGWEWAMKDKHAKS